MPNLLVNPALKAAEARLVEDTTDTAVMVSTWSWKNNISFETIDVTVTSDPFAIEEFTGDQTFWDTQYDLSKSAAESMVAGFTSSGANPIDLT